MREAGRLARFTTPTARPERSHGLQPNHPAVLEQRTLFPGTVVGTFQSRRFLIAGENSAKIGKMVEKGAWAGFPVFTLTLEERATCPPACAQWLSCFGNAMPWARRNDALDPDFIPALKAEVVTLVRETCAPIPNRPKFTPPKGIVIRLHVLGDFFSIAYVRMWADLFRFLPELRVFGYTAHRVEDGSPIAAELAKVAAEFGDRWMIRTSHVEPGAGRTVVVESDDAIELYRADVILCPAQTKASECCSTCSLCWSPNAWDKTVAFLRHGMVGGAARKGTGAKRKTSRSIELNERGLTAAQEALYQAMRELADSDGLVNAGSAALCRWAGVSLGNWQKLSKAVLGSRCVQLLRRGGGRGAPSVYRVFETAQEAFPPAPAVPMPAAKPKAPVHSGDHKPPRREAAPLVTRKPDAPLVIRSQLDGLPKHRPAPVKAKYNARGTLLNPSAIGSAERLAVGAPEDRIAAVGESELERIQRTYGATVKKATAE